MQVYLLLGGGLQTTKDGAVFVDPESYGIPYFTRESPADAVVGTTQRAELSRERCVRSFWLVCCCASCLSTRTGSCAGTSEQMQGSRLKASPCQRAPPAWSSFWRRSREVIRSAAN